MKTAKAIREEITSLTQEIAVCERESPLRICLLRRRQTLQWVLEEETLQDTVSRLLREALTAKHRHEWYSVGHYAKRLLEVLAEDEARRTE